MEETFARYINVNGQLMDLSQPRVMGILNITPDSFYADSRKQTEKDIIARIHQILDEGGDFIDIGAYSSRPDASDVSPKEEMERLKYGLEILRNECPEAVVSVDTFRADVAKMCVEEYGVALINDIAAGQMDPEMFSTIAQLKVPYIMMHMQGTPQNMQKSSLRQPGKRNYSLLCRKNRKTTSLWCKRPDYRPRIWFRKNLGTQL